MSEYDYSGLYNNGGPQNNNGQPAGTQPEQPQAEQSGYPNVGSSGMNTANTAQTDYSNYSSQQNSSYNPQGPVAGNGGNGGNGNNGGYNGYSYSSNPQPPQNEPKKSHGGKKVLLRVAACIGVVALGFGGGLAGTVVASRTGLTGGQVVVQQVQRDTNTDSVSQGSTNGTNLSIQDVAALVQPSVVAITTEQMVSTNTWFGGSYVQSGAGSGVIISQDGYIVTCAHVVSGANNITVQLADGTEYTATVVGQDSTSDVAVLKIEATGLTPAVIGDSDSLAVGETTIAVGNPLGTLSNTVTNGIVSALNREVTVQGNDMNLIQTSASISPGNSGGGLFNANGELIGIVNAKSADEDAEGLGFAIPVNTALSIAQQLIETGYVSGRPAMGVTVLEITDAQTAARYGVNAYGVYIADVTAGSGADKAGLKAGDRIISINGNEVSQNADLTNVISDCEVGDVVTLTIARDGQILTVDVTLGDRNAAAAQNNSAAPSEQAPSSGEARQPGGGR